jgi:hypothetical protein
LNSDCIPFSDDCEAKARITTTPTVRALAQDIDTLEEHIEKFGSVVAQSPDVWGQARMTKHRQDFEDQLAAELGNFAFSLQGSLSRSDQAYFMDSMALSSAAAAQNSGPSTVVSNSNGAGGGTPSSTAMSQSSAPSVNFQGGGTISVEPEVFLDQKARYINHLNELRRINEGDDTADSPGYALNLVRIPVSIFPGKCTDVGHGAEVTMTLKPILSEELLPTTFRNLVLNDLVEQIDYPLTQFVNNPNNTVYLDDSKSSADLFSDAAQLFKLVDDAIGAETEPYPDTIQELFQRLKGLRFKLTLQPIFSLPDWNWVDGLLKNENSKTDKNAFGPYLKSITQKLQPGTVVPSTKSRRARLPFPPSQIASVYGFEYSYLLALSAYLGLAKKERFATPCPDSSQVYLHLPDIQGYLQEELVGAYKLLANPTNSEIWSLYCTETLANAVQSQQLGNIIRMRKDFARLLSEKNPGVPTVTVALSWAIIVESTLLTQQLVQDMKESFASKRCPCPHTGWLDYYYPNPSLEAREAFNAYVRCRWPIHIFAIDPVTQQQNIADTYSSSREMQLAMSIAFVSGNLSANNMMQYARKLQFDMATVDLNNTQVGFSHGDDTFGWRFYPRFQTPEIESNGTVFFRDMLIGGPSRNALLRQRRLEPGQRECVAVVIMPSFVPYADLTVTANWFSLTNPKHKLMNSDFAMRLSKSIRTIEKFGPGVMDNDCYREGDVGRLLEKAKQLSNRMPLQSSTVQIPYENTLGGFGLFNTGVTDLAPELTGWYGSPSINPCQPTSVFLVGNHFSVHQTRVIAGGQQVVHEPVTSGKSNSSGSSSEMLSRQVLKVVIPPNTLLVGDANQKFVDVQVATPYGLTQHLLIPVCSTIATCGTQPPVANDSQPASSQNSKSTTPTTQSPLTPSKQQSTPLNNTPSAIPTLPMPSPSSTPSQNGGGSQKGATGNNSTSPMNSNNSTSGETPADTSASSQPKSTGTNSSTPKSSSKKQ